MERLKVEAFTTNGVLGFSGSGSNGNVVFAEFQVDAEPIPEPSTMLLLGFGLVGLGFFGRRKIAA